MEDDVRELEKNLALLKNQFAAWAEERKLDSVEAARTRDNNHRETMITMRRIEKKQDDTNGKVLDHRERIIRLEERDKIAAIVRPPATIIETPGAIAAGVGKVPSQVQWAALGAMLFGAIAYMVEKLADVVATLADKIPVGLQ